MNRLIWPHVITEIRIENFKSIVDLTLKPGRVTVLIGENGSGKSNILEAIAFGAGAAGNKLDREFLYSRGIRVTESEWMRSAFVESKVIHLTFAGENDGGNKFNWNISPITHIDGSFDRWQIRVTTDRLDIKKHLATDEAAKQVDESMTVFRLAGRAARQELGLIGKGGELSADQRATLTKLYEDIIADYLTSEKWRVAVSQSADASMLTDFLIYAPENTVLRAFDPEGAIEPLGSKGEGLLKLLQSFGDEKYKDRFLELKEALHALGWFGDLALPDAGDAFRDRIRITDQLLPQEKSTFDQRSANEGFLLLLFYFVLFLSWRTPKFFAIDNIDTALNPKLCATLMRQLAALAAKYGKQVIFTTHNPAILDGLDLNDDEQRLFVVHRNDDGHTKVRRVSAPEPRPGERPIKLSEAFLRGLIGGLPNNF